MSYFTMLPFVALMYLTTRGNVTSVGPKGNGIEARGPPLTKECKTTPSGGENVILLDVSSSLSNWVVLLQSLFHQYGAGVSTHVL